MLRTGAWINYSTQQSQMILSPDDQQQKQIDVSVVIPLLNEEENLELLYNHLKAALNDLGKNFEIIFVDDGSKDRTFSILKSLHEQDPRLWIIRFRRNFGQTAAFSAGFHLA